MKLYRRISKITFVRDEIGFGIKCKFEEKGGVYLRHHDDQWKLYQDKELLEKGEKNWLLKKAKSHIVHPYLKIEGDTGYTGMYFCELADTITDRIVKIAVVKDGK